MTSKFLKTTIIAFGVILFLIWAYVVGHFILSILSLNSEPEFENIYDCKIYYWEDCGLIIDEEMCYQTEENINAKWFDCQIVSQKVIDCWTKKMDYCVEKIK